MSADKRASTFYGERVVRHRHAKFAVALRAVSYLDEGDSLLIDAGTSLTPIAQIVLRLADQTPDLTHFTLMTHNRAAFDALVPVRAEARLNVFLTGGRYDADLNALFGDQAETAYERFHPKWVFIGQNGIDADRGLFCHGNTEELALKRIVFAKPAAARVIISDYTKLGVPGGLCFGESSKLTDNVEGCILITDTPEEHSDDRRAHGPYGADAVGLTQRFEEQVRKLEETYNVKVERVRWTEKEHGSEVTLTDTDTKWSVTLRLDEEQGASYRVERLAFPAVRSS